MKSASRTVSRLSISLFIPRTIFLKQLNCSGSPLFRTPLPPLSVMIFSKGVLVRSTIKRRVTKGSEHPDAIQYQDNCLTALHTAVSNHLERSCCEVRSCMYCLDLGPFCGRYSVLQGVKAALHLCICSNGAGMILGKNANVNWDQKVLQQCRYHLRNSR